MASDDLAKLAEELEALPGYNGWSFAYEHPGFFCFSRNDKPIHVWATPDHNELDKIDVQVEIDNDGTYDENPPSDPAFPRKGRTAEGYLAAMRPILDHYAPPPDVTICCAVCGSSDVSYAVWHRPNTNEIGDIFGSWNAGDNTFCDDCDDCTNLVDKGAEPELFAKARAKYFANNDEEG